MQNRKQRSLSLGHSSQNLVDGIGGDSVGHQNPLESGIYEIKSLNKFLG
jgi:hypothetical protein